MNGKDLFLGMNYVSRKYIEEAGKEPEEKKAGKYAAPKSGRIVMKKALLIAATIATMLILMGAAVYTHWSSSMQQQYRPSENAKQQAEKTGLSVMYEESEPEDGSVLTATDNGVTVTVVQTIVDQMQAKIILRVEGFAPPEETRVTPIAWWQEDRPTLDGSPDIFGGANVDFDNGAILTSDRGEIYWDGTPVEHYEDGWPIYHYIRDDGSMELVVWYRFQDTNGGHIGKEYQLHLTGFGIARQKGPADDNFEKLVDGHWDLRFPLTGSKESIKKTVEAPIFEGVNLTDVEIGELSLKTQYRIDTENREYEELGDQEPQIRGVKMKDGTFVEFWPSNSGFRDQEHLIYYIDAYATNGVVDPNQVESLVYSVGANRDPDTGRLVPIYKYIPLG